MRILGLDLETTGLDIQKDSIIEMAFVLKEVGNPRPLLMETHLIWEKFYTPPSEENVRLHGITAELLEEHGVTFEYACKKLQAALRFDVDCIVAHNGENFDKPFLFRQMKDHDLTNLHRIYETPWVDSKQDVVYPFATRKLKYLAAEHGLLNPKSHMALFDVLTMLDVLSFYDMKEVLARSKIPWITVRALVNYEQREDAKKCYFLWEVSGDKIYPKCWVKRIKECDFAKEKEKANFEIVRIE